MKRISIPFYNAGYALTDYFDKNGKGDDVSLFIWAMKRKPSIELESKISLLIDGWVSWIVKELASLNIKFDIIIRALGHDELEYDSENPMSILSVRIAGELGIEHRTDLIRKIKKTESQTSLKYDYNAWRRRKNVESSVISTVNNDYLKDKTILVLDDIKTTGSTLISIATALCSNGQSNLYCLALGESTNRPQPTDFQLLSHLRSSTGIQS